MLAAGSGVPKVTEWGWIPGLLTERPKESQSGCQPTGGWGGRGQGWQREPGCTVSGCVSRVLGLMMAV